MSQPPYFRQQSYHNNVHTYYRMEPAVCNIYARTYVFYCWKVINSPRLESLYLNTTVDKPTDTQLVTLCETAAVSTRLNEYYEKLKITSDLNILNHVLKVLPNDAMDWWFAMSTKLMGGARAELAEQILLTVLKALEK